MISGTTIERSTSTYIDKYEKITPTSDRIILKPLKWEPSKIIEAVRHGRPVRGEILAIGPGAYRKRYNKDKSKMWETNVFVPTQLKVGDIVELGGLNIFDGMGLIFDTCVWGNEQCLIVQEADVTYDGKKPLHGNIMVKPCEKSNNKNGFYIKDSTPDEFNEGIVIAIGEDVKELKPTMRIGYGRLIGTESTIDGISHLVMKEADVAFVVE